MKMRKQRNLLKKKQKKDLDGAEKLIEEKVALEKSKSLMDNLESYGSYFN